MKEKTYRRTIKPKQGSRAKPRKGLLGIIKRTTENREEVDDYFRNLKGPASPIENLQTIIEDTAEFTKNLPDDGRYYVVYPSGKWKYLPEIYATASAGKRAKIKKECQNQGALETCIGLTFPSSLFDPCSPEHFAVEARQYARLAITDIETGDLVNAVRSAMKAVDRHHHMIFAEEYERTFLKGLESEQCNKQKSETAVSEWEDLVSEMKPLIEKRGMSVSSAASHVAKKCKVNAKNLRRNYYKYR